ncbi:hypothetical protein FJTKL_11650 [Diaporthe vaccinii]|uniref:Uncharacterized protein n=1 Tax=Diaporthe vaccinii TaxID=105482 RepID=A0ABR4EGI1_9PEZI
MFPRHSCDIHDLATLHLHDFILANTRSTTAQHRLPHRTPTACLGISGQAHSRLRLLPTSPGYLEVYDNSARVKGTKGSHKRVRRARPETQNSLAHKTRKQPQPHRHPSRQESTSIRGHQKKERDKAHICILSSVATLGSDFFDGVIL